jgi:branched-chain amino acid transport system ATP-binding protein
VPLRALAAIHPGAEPPKRALERPHERASPVLEVRSLSKHFGGIRAVDDCSFTVERGSITALIGPNGAGKTTAFNCISKTMPLTTGEVWLEGERIDRLRPCQVTRRGLSRTFQISRNLEDLTVLENLVVQSRVPHWRNLFGAAVTPAEQEKAMEILDFLGITRLAYEETRSLSYGQKKLMDFGALLMSEPKIILLDEPAGGINPRLLGEIVDRIRKLNQRGLTVLIVEHNMEVVMSLSDKVVVMAHGQVIAEGSPREVQANRLVLEAYLGGTERGPPAPTVPGAGHA